MEKLLILWGTLRYRGWWIILDVDYELGRYLRHLYFLAHHRCRKLGKPSWGEHITVVVGKEYTEKFPLFWNKYENEEIQFNISFDLATNGNAFWIPIASARLNEIRDELGLGEPYVPLHFGFGYENPGKCGLNPIS